MSNNYGAHTSYLGCYSSPNPFNGYTDANGPAPGLGTFGPAQFVGGSYKAQLNSCVNNSGSKPCFQFLDGSALPNPYVVVTIQTPPGDPNFR